MSTQAACKTVAQEFAKHEQKLNILVNNSGTSWGEPFEKHSEKGWDKGKLRYSLVVLIINKLVMDLNVKGVFFLTQALAPLLEAAATKGDPARVINVGSVAGLFPQAIPTYAYPNFY